MKPPLDPHVQAQIDQFAKESAALGAFYEQAVGYVAAQRLTADLIPKAHRYRRSRYGRLFGKVLQLMRRKVRRVTPDINPVILEGEVITATTIPVPNDTGTVDATVIVIDMP